MKVIISKQIFKSLILPCIHSDFLATICSDDVGATTTIATIKWEHFRACVAELHQRQIYATFQEVTKYPKHHGIGSSREMRVLGHGARGYPSPPYTWVRGAR